jgi:hypothetical protein
LYEVVDIEALAAYLRSVGVGKITNDDIELKFDFKKANKE